MKASAANVKDVEKYYLDTYLLVPEISTKTVFRLMKVNGNGMVLRHPITGDEGTILFKDGFEYEIKSPLTVRKQWFMYGDRAYFIERIPARQWQKGVSAENTMIYRAGTAGTGEPIGIDGAKLNAVLNFKAVETLDFSQPYSVLSEQFMFCSSKNLLFLWDTVVSKLSRRTKELFVPKELEQLILPPQLSNFKVKYV